jgi:hypothetical protein
MNALLFIFDPHSVRRRVSNPIVCVLPQFWDTIRVEHGLNEEGQYEGDNKLQLERMDVYFNEAEYVMQLRSPTFDLYYSKSNWVCR